VDGGGNYVVTAKNPAGPWSDPTWLPELEGGIDPSMFVDDDGRAYVLNNGPPEGTPRYNGHRAIWIQEFDRAALKLQGPRKVLVDGGVDPGKNPIWIEGPHIYKRAGWYYLSCAEGGTGPQHSQVVLRARSPWGPFEAYSGNPILTQRDLAPDRKQPITNAGHAELVEAPDGSWWATFLATRTYEGVHYNTGRETFLLPVTWRDGWPVILEHGRAIPYVVRGPKFMAAGDQQPLSGNFTWRDEFDGATLDQAWLQLRARNWVDLRRTPGALSIDPQATRLDDVATPAFLARRQLHLVFDESEKSAMERGIRVTGSELVGLVPLSAMLEAGKYFLTKQQLSTGVSDSELIHIAVKSMGLDELAPFDPRQRIIEYCLEAQNENPLIGMTLTAFSEETASESPAPGGGSISAYVGTLGISLGAMVANLSAVKKGWEDRWEEFSDWAVQGQQLRKELLSLVDEDTRSFNAIMNAFQLPKGNEVETAARKKAIQDATRYAIEVPFRVMERALDSMEILQAMVEKGNPNSITDAGVGVLCARVAVTGAPAGSWPVKTDTIEDRGWPVRAM